MVLVQCMEQGQAAFRQEEDMLDVLVVQVDVVVDERSNCNGVFDDLPMIPTSSTL